MKITPFPTTHAVAHETDKYLLEFFQRIVFLFQFLTSETRYFKYLDLVNKHFWYTSEHPPVLSNKNKRAQKQALLI